mgnify:FL=1
MNEPMVVTVDDSGEVVGTAPRLAAHRDAIRHLAISVVVIGNDGRVLLQQRAAGKALFAGRWSNTVCTHPLPGEPVANAALRRLEEELSVRCHLTLAGMFSYRALDPDSGLTEHELDHVFVGRAYVDPVPDPHEVAAVPWITPADLAAEMSTAPDSFTPWLLPVLVAAGLEDGSFDAGHLPSGTSAYSQIEDLP